MTRPCVESAIGQRSAQQGVSLIVVLLILVIVSLIGISGAKIVMMGERSSRNERDQQLAWQAAEAALMDAEFDMRGPGTATRQTVFAPGNLADFVANCGTTGNSRGLCLPAITGSPVWLTANLASTSGPGVPFGSFTSRVFATGSQGVVPVRAPRYIIEALADPAPLTDQDARNQPKYIYRVTSLGFGPREDIQAVMQMVFRKGE